MKTYERHRCRTRCFVGLLVIVVLAQSSQFGRACYAAGQVVRLPVVQAAPYQVPPDWTLRVRLLSMVPAESSVVQWRYGGEGQGGRVVRGRFARPGVPQNASDSDHALAIAEWSAPVPVASLASRFPKRLFLTVTAGRAGRVVDRVSRRRAEFSTDVVFEFEFRLGTRVVKTFSVNGPDGGTATIVVPAYRLTAGVTPADPRFLKELTSVLEYARQRAELLEGLPWADGPLPKKFAIVNNVGGYGVGFGYGVRTTDKAVTLTELRSLRQLGVNGFRGGPEFLLAPLRHGRPGTVQTRVAGPTQQNEARKSTDSPGVEKDPDVKVWDRVMIAPVMGFPVPQSRGRPNDDPEAGCPFGTNVASRTRALVAESLASVLELPAQEVWGLTVDEIGTVIDRSADKKAHLSVCPRCTAAFQDWLRSKGLTAGDFGVSRWSDVKPLNVWDPESNRPWLNDRGLALAAYYTRDFNNYVTAKLFSELRTAFTEKNKAKRNALQRGDWDAPEARQPWIYSYALRGNTFLMKGHSLDFFDFYRLADNGMVYETSNREPRIWGWDSYLCDVQRVVAERWNLARGIYIKPHRGAPVQRMLAAVSRGNTMIYWYTYGPDYKKGDSFSQDPEALRLTSKAAHLLAKAEDAIYGSHWAVPARVAIVKPETTQRWMNLSGNPPALVAAWENAKWVYAALQHAHIPVDPIDEQMLAQDDLSQYRIVYVNGSHLRSDAIEGLARYVAQGGTVWTSGGGLARDEANQLSPRLQALVGLERRRAPEMYYTVSLYGAGRIESYDEAQRQIASVPDNATILAGGPVQRPFGPRIGREALEPAPGTQVLARFRDGGAAVTRHRVGRGQVYVCGFFPGLEYSAAVRRADYDMRRDLDPALRTLIAAPALEQTQPVVDASDPLTEGVLLRNSANGARAVTLANWAYAVTALRQDPSGKQTPIVTHRPIQDVRVTIRGAGSVREVASCTLERTLEFTSTKDRLTVSLPRLEEGDVLLLR